MASALCFAIVFVFACLNLRSIVNADCYIGVIRSNEAGNLPISYVHALKVQDCGPSPKPTTTVPTTSAEVITTEITTEVTTLMTTNLTTTGVPSNLTTTYVPTTEPTTQAKPTSTPAPTTTPSPPPTTTPKSNLTDAPTTTKTPWPTTIAPEPVTSCAYFKYYEDTKLTPSSVWVANFSCVKNCVSGPATMYGKNGTLTCCNSANCNSLDRFMQDEKVKYQTVGQCAIGDTDAEDINLKFNQSCTSDMSYFCVNKTFTANQNMTYRCSYNTFDKFCIDHNFVTASGGCAKDDTDNTTKCCCTLDNCNYHSSPPEPPSPEPPTPHHGLSKGTITGLVFMGFFIGFIAGCCLTCYCFKKKRSSGDSVDFNYQRISANTPEDAEY